MVRQVAETSGLALVMELTFVSDLKNVSCLKIKPHIGENFYAEPLLCNFYSHMLV